VSYPFSDKDVVRYGDQFQICFRYPDDTPVRLIGPHSAVLVKTANQLYKKRIKCAVPDSSKIPPRAG